MQSRKSRDPLLEYLDARDAEHFTACVRALRGRVVRAAAKVLHDRSRAEDVAQDIFLRLLDPRWEPEGIRLGERFLIVTAKRLARARLLGETRRRARELRAVARRGALRRRNGHGRDERLDVDEAVEALPAALMLCIKHRRAGLSVEEIVKVTGFSRNKVLDLLAHAYRRLRRRLRDSTGAILLAGLLDGSGASSQGVPVAEGFEGERRKRSRGDGRRPAHPRAQEREARAFFPWLPLVLPAVAAVALAAILIVGAAAVGPGAGDLELMPRDRRSESATQSEPPPRPGPPAVSRRRLLDHVDVNWGIEVNRGSVAERER